MLRILLAALTAAPLFLVGAEQAVAADGGMTEIQLDQSAERMIPHDRLTVYLRVEAKGNDPRQVQAEINDRMKESLAKVRTQPSVVAETGSYSVHRLFNEKEPDQWEASQQLALSSGKFDDLLNLAGILQNDGLIMSSMRFFTSPETLKATQDELTTAALKALRDRAGRIAADLGMRIGRYKTIDIGNASEQSGDGPARLRMAVASTDRKMSPPTAVADESQVTLSVHAVVVMMPQ